MPRPVSTAPAAPRASARRTAVHHTHTSNTPSVTSVPSVATSSRVPAHDGAPATVPVTDR
ncbi:hypothetical protein [Streptomyces sp. NPDC005930]|uniref:hypothetical protein n=1 Tax=Streptomyces sp. NPDC005930 TaxID=3364736 RepID=UPI0036808808